MHAGLAGGADVILIPEIPYDIQRVCDKVRRRQAAGRFFSIVVVAEGAHPKDGQKSFLEAKVQGGMPRLGGAGAQAAAEISKLTGLETRVTVLGHLLRGGRPSAYDRILATRYGAAAIDLEAENKWGHMVALQGGGIGSVPITDVIAGTTGVEPDGEMVNVARSLGIEVGQ